MSEHTAMQADLLAAEAKVARLTQALEKVVMATECRAGTPRCVCTTNDLDAHHIAKAALNNKAGAIHS